MSGKLVDLIAAVARTHEMTDKPTWANERICACGESVRANFMAVGSRYDHAEHVAAEVVAVLKSHPDTTLPALGATKEDNAHFGDRYTDDHPATQRRWVFGWVPVGGEK